MPVWLAKPIWRRATRSLPIKMTQDFYKQIFVWRKLTDKQALRHCCFENLTTGRFFVQSADFFHLPYDQKMDEQHSAQFIELFLEVDDAERTQHQTLKRAISEFNQGFSIVGPV